MVIKLKDRECVICHKMYTPRSGNQKTCSKACREKYVKKMTPIWNKRSYQKNKAKRKQQNKEYINAYRKDYYKKNKDKVKKQGRDWREKNKDKRKEYEKRWYDEHKTYLKDYRRQRREKQIEDAFSRYHEYLKTID